MRHGIKIKKGATLSILAIAYAKDAQDCNFQKE